MGTENGSLVKRSPSLSSHLSRSPRPRTYLYALMYQLNHLRSQGKLGCRRTQSWRTQNPPICWSIYKHSDDLYNRSPAGVCIVDWFWDLHQVSNGSLRRIYLLISVTLSLTSKDQAILNTHEQILAVIPGLEEQVNWTQMNNPSGLLELATFVCT